MAQSGHEYDQSDPVVAQYEQWAYPTPVDDLTSPAIAPYVASFQSLREMSPVYWPAGQPREELDVLVAGCGSMAAAVYAHLYPKCQVVGIDISRASLAHEEKLKAKYRLQNLTLQRLPIEEVSSLAAEFDYISCHGVLHHMPDPTAGLRALGQVLRRDGIIAMMVYGKYGRAQVYVFQDLFRLMGLEQTPQDVAVVRETLMSLPLDHPLQHYLKRAIDLNADAGLVDTFLHRRDRAYSVSDCLTLVREAGLVFQGWDQNLIYYPDAFFPGAPRLREKLDRLPQEQVWQAMEMLTAFHGMHWFHACRSDRDPATYRIPWGTEKLLDCIPHKRVQLMQRTGPGGQPEYAMGQQSVPPVALTGAQAALFSQINGQRTVRQGAQAAGLDRTDPEMLAISEPLLRLLHRTGYGVITFPRGR